MRLMTSLLMAGFLVACGDKDEDTATEEVVEDSAAEEETEAEVEVEVVWKISPLTIPTCHHESTTAAGSFGKFAVTSSVRLSSQVVLLGSYLKGLGEHYLLPPSK